MYSAFPVCEASTTTANTSRGNSRTGDCCWADIIAYVIFGPEEAEAPLTVNGVLIAAVVG